MKTFKALLVKEDGLIYAAEIMEEPKFNLCADQEKALYVLWQSDERIHSPIPFLYWKENMLKPGIYPIPGLQGEARACPDESEPSITLQQCKDAVAKGRAYESWKQMEAMEHQVNAGSWQFLLKATEEAAELYASKKLEEYRREQDRL